MEVFPEVAALTQEAAFRFVRLAQAAVTMRGVFTVALSGGSTPKSLYTLMAADQNLRVSIPWSKIHFFFGDDVGARSNLKRWLRLEKPLDYDAVRRTLDRWHPYAGLICFHMLLDRLAEARFLQAGPPQKTRGGHTDTHHSA